MQKAEPGASEAQAAVVLRVGPTRRRIFEFCESCSGILPQMGLPRLRVQDLAVNYRTG